MQPKTRGSGVWARLFEAGSVDAIEGFLNGLDTWPVGIVMTDALLDEPGPRIVYANQTFCTIAGKPIDQILGRSPRFLQGPATARRELDRLRRCLERQETFYGETVNYRSDGTPFIMRWNVFPVYDTAQQLRFFCALQMDVTEERRLESVAEAKTLTESLGILFTTLRHELANPVNSARAALTLLRSQVHEQPPEKTVHVLDRVMIELERIVYLIKDLRSYSAFESKVVEPVDLRALLERIVATLGPEAERRGIALESSPAANPPRALADSRALFQVLINLITNAFEAIAGDTRARADKSLAPMVRLSCDAADNGTVAVVVSNNGPPLSLEQQSRIFRPFFTTKSGGSGLGLTIVQKMVTQMDATIEVRSQLETDGAWTSFDLRFPRAVEP